MCTLTEEGTLIEDAKCDGCELCGPFYEEC